MSTNSTDRIVTTAHWVLKEDYNLDNILTKGKVLVNYVKAMIEVAAADGVLSEREHQWVIGYANAIGASQEDIDEIQSYQRKGMSDLLKIFQIETGHAHGQHALLSLIYDGFRAANADGELHQKELEAIYALGQALGASKEQIKQLHDVFQDEQQVRRRRLAILFPTGCNYALDEIEKGYEKAATK